jgi:ligand-binding sensor domain-containing protein
MKNFILLFNFLLFLFSCKEEEKNAFNVAPNSEISSNSKSAPSDAESNTSNLVPQLSYDNSTGTKIALGKQLYVAPSIFEHNGPEITHCEIKQGTTYLPPKIYIHPQTCIVYGTPSLPLHKTKFTIVAKNKNGTSSDAILNLEVINASVPSLGYQNSIGKIGVVGNPMKVTPSSFHGNGSPVTNCFIQPGTNPLPASLLIHPNTCEIYGTPTSVYVSSYEFKIIASNLAGESLVAKVVLQVNPAPPSSASLLINNGDVFANHTTVKLTPSSVNASQMYITNVEGCKIGGHWANYSTSRIWALSQLNSNATVYVKYRNNIREETECVSDTITHDNIPPSAGLMLINNGMQNTNSINVTISLSATEATEMYITNSSGCTTEGIWEKYVSTRNWSLGVTNAKAIVYAKFRDAAGNESQCISGSIFHQSENLLANDISINSGDKITKSSVISISVLATSASEMYVTNTPGCLSDGIWETYGTKKTWTLAQKNAVATVFVKFRNRYGNESSCISDSIIHDNIAPSNVSILINNNALYTNLTKIYLSLGASGAHEMFITSIGGCSVEGSWEPYNTAKSWTITNLNSTTYVYAKFRDIAGNESACISKSIIHDDQPPLKNAIYLNGNNTYTNSSYVQVTLISPESSHVYVTNTPSCVSDGTWEKISQAKENWNLSQKNSSSNVYAKFRDAAGNESTCITDSIIHDNIPPIFPSISINNGDSFTNLKQVNLNLSVENASEMYISNSPFCSINGIWEKYEPTKIWTLEQTNMTVSVYVRFKDEAGNITSCINDNINHDNLAPTVNSVKINNDVSHVFSESVDLSLESTGANEMFITNSSDCMSGGFWEPFSKTKNWKLDQINSVAFVYVKFKDIAGNQTTCISDSIIQKNLSINFLPQDGNHFLSNNVLSTFVNGTHWYVSTDLGLSISEDNGKTFRNKTLKDGLGSNNTRRTKVFGNSVFVGTSGGLSISSDNGNTFQNYNLKDGLASNEVNDIYVLNGKILVATEKGLSISNNQLPTFKNILNDIAIYKIKVDTNGFIYLASYNGVYISQDGGDTFYLKNKSNGLRNNLVRSICINNQGQILAATQTGISVSNDQGNIFSDLIITTPTNVYNEIIGFDVECDDINIFAITNSGLFISTNNGRSFSIFSSQQGLINSSKINEIYLVQDKTAFISTSNGISVTSDFGKNFTNYTSPIGVGSSYIRDIYVSNSNHLFLSTTNGTFKSHDNNFYNHYLTGFTNQNIGRYIYEGSHLYSVLDSKSIFKNNTKLIASGVPGNVSDFFVDNQNTLFIATNSGLSVSHFGNEVSGTQYFSTLTTNYGLGSNVINKVFVDSSNTAYVATTEGLSISSTSSVFNNKTTLNGLGSNNVMSVFVDPVYGYIYAGTSAGLSISTNHGMNFLNKNSKNGLTSSVIRDIFVDDLGRIILATDQGIQMSFDGGNTFVILGEDSGLCGNNVNSLFAKNSTVYIGTTTGACSFSF